MTNALTFEKLEDRKLLAVSATQRGSTLNVTGSNGNDAVAIDGVAPGVVVVTDLDTGFATLFVGVRNINVDTKAGIDAVLVGAGSGLLDLAGGKLSIRTGNDIDIVAVTGLQNSQLAVKTDGGSDVVAIVDSAVLGKTSINTGSDDDAVIFDNSLFAQDVSVDTGSGVDIFAADDCLFSGSLNVNLGSGNDFVAVTDSLVGGGFSVNGGTGIDEVLDFGGTVVIGTVKLKSLEIT
jgi:hypothetical protein